jgi:NAD(P)-dependent dehydrogenase (short-subunit alcohol dehydrogenase family)
MAKWTAADMPPMSGQVVVVTGATSGVGLATAAAFARARAHVVLAVRDVGRGEQVARGLGGSTEVRRLDLADLASVRAFAASWDRQLDVLVNNAGVAGPGPRTRDGFERQFGTNHLGPFALTNLLLPHITGRVVTVASGTHKSATIHFDDLNQHHRRLGFFASYGQSKLANLLFTLDLDRRLREADSGVRAMAARPGYSATNIGLRGRNRILAGAVRLVGRAFAQTPEQGALPSLFAATQDVPSAGYVGPDGRTGLHGHPTLVGRSAEASDPAVARRLWSASEELTGVTFGLG